MPEVVVFEETLLMTLTRWLGSHSTEEPVELVADTAA